MIILALEKITNFKNSANSGRIPCALISKTLQNLADNAIFIHSFIMILADYFSEFTSIKQDYYHFSRKRLKTISIDRLHKTA
jgi:hypothetical protein